MSDSELYATDETFRAVADLLFGGGGDQLLAQISKANPSQSDLATADRKKRRLTAGLSATGAVAGAAGLGYAGAKMGQAARGAYKVSPHARKGPRLAGALKHGVKSEKGAAVLLPLEVAGLGGEVMATHILHGDTKRSSPKKGSLVKKNDVNDIVSQAGSIPTKRSITRAVVANPKVQAKGIETTQKTAGMLRKVPSKIKTSNKVEKRSEPVEVTWSGEFAKADAEKQQIFGWASVVEVGGEPVLDLQGDVISPEEMEKAGYSYVMKSRKGGDMHLRDNWAPIQKSEMIESFIVTDDKREAMGLPDSVPTGWWVGFQVQDPQVWSDIKAGKRTGFSIHGTGRRTPA
jgi:hypothetical protein